jgi:type I site-specific restriction endonuclease
MENLEIREETRGKKKELDHEKFMKAKGMETAELPEELQEADKILKEAKKNNFEAANEASKLILEALQESIYEINSTIEKIGETLTDHEERLEALEQENQEQEEQIEELQEQAQEEEEKEKEGEEQPPVQSLETENQETFSSKEEAILAKLYADGVEYITKIELKALGFNIGFFSKLGARGATYGGYQLEKAPSEKVYKVLKLV